MLLDDSRIEPIRAEIDALIDTGIIEHGFMPHMRDYRIVVQWASVSNRPGTYHYVFTHCPYATVTTSLSDGAWNESWSDDFIDWDRAKNLDGFIWAARWSSAYPGGRYVRDSPLAAEWAHRFGRQMHEMMLTTEAFHLRLVFHRLIIRKISDDTCPVDQVMFPLK